MNHSIPNLTEQSNIPRRGGKKAGNAEGRLWARVRKTDHCWEWIGGKTDRGYGHLRRDGIRILAHRFSWELVHGPIPDDLCVLHRCDNPSCVRPDHLFLGTRLDNMADMVKKGRHVTATPGKSYACKLTIAQVIEIRKLSADGVRTVALTRIYGVDRATVWKIVTRRTWKKI